MSDKSVGERLVDYLMEVDDFKVEGYVKEKADAILSLIDSEFPKEPYCKYMDETNNQSYLEGYEDCLSEIRAKLRGTNPELVKEK